MKLAQILEGKGRLSGAAVYYKGVIDEFPETRAASQARNRLRQLGGL